MAPVRDRSPFPPRIVKQVRWFASTLAGSVILSFAPLPLGMVGLPFALAALVFGIASMVAIRRQPSTGLWTFVIIGFLMAGSLSLNYAAAALLYREFYEYQECTSQAITIAAKDQCYLEFREAAGARLEGWGIPVPWADESSP